MKRCPSCRHTYTDKRLRFCRFDGATLVSVESDPIDSGTTIDLSASKADLETRRELAVNTPSPSNTPSIAVLPFVNMSGDRENEYFCDGLAEEKVWQK